ncbi:hypothetical protein FA95DRAFT_1552859 [Auriscalpium vulgare]|uniref:Uncharacterized protein n=1 Tax=Auriscalpium vulgare TaxID=40419 RepID=A0ACB8SAK4_9AGAM|nr:hypothetical protein FA95DRAFT_1552859 [Auriscalpium vulgare]
MDIPSARELDLEALLRNRDAQLAQLTDEVSLLRRYLPTQPGPSTTEPVSLPPALVSVLLPHLNATADGAAAGSSSTVTTALTQRTKLLQEENDELYELLKSSETGKLKEEVRGLRRAVDRLEIALRESHQVIKSLSDELDKSYELALTPARQHNNAAAHQSTHPSRPLHQPPPHMAPHSTSNGSETGNGNGSAGSKPVPTGPRAHKKPRLSEPRTSPSAAKNALPRIETQASNRSTSRHMDSPEHSPLLSPVHRKVSGGKVVEMAVDGDRDGEPRARQRSPAPKERDRDRERGKDRDKRDKERERDRDRTSRRNGHGRRSGRSGGGGRDNAPFAGGDRTLAERMGL